MSKINSFKLSTELPEEELRELDRGVTIIQYPDMAELPEEDLRELDRGVTIIQYPDMAELPEEDLRELDRGVTIIQYPDMAELPEEELRELDRGVTIIQYPDMAELPEEDLRELDRGVTIIQYPDMAELPEEDLRELVDIERELYGYEGFGEYAVCTNPECRRVLSIDNVYGVKDTPEQYVPLEELESERACDLRCPDCDAKAELVFHPELTPWDTQIYFSQQVYGAILKKDGKIAGASAAFVAPLRMGVVADINYRELYDVDSIIKEIADRLGRTVKEIEDQPTVFWNRVALLRNARGGQNFASLASAVLDQHPEYDEIPTVADTRFDSNAYPLGYSFGYEFLQTDTYGGVVAFLKKTGILRRAISMSREEFKRELGGKFAEGKITHNEYKLAHPAEDRKRYFKGLPLVPERLLNFGISVNDVRDSSSFETANGRKVRIENYTSKQISEKTLGEISDFYRYIFANAFGQFLVYPSDGKPISASQIFGTGKEYVSLEDLDNFDLDSYPRHPVSGEKAVYWHDPGVTLKRFSEKSRENANFTVLRDIENSQLLGLMFGHKTTLRELFQSEEWEDPLYYSSERSPHKRNFDHFLKRVNEERAKKGYQPFKPQSNIYGWNCIVTHPDIRGLDNLSRLTSAFFNGLPREYVETLEVMGEGQYGSRAHALFLAVGPYQVKGVLCENEDLKAGDPVIIGESLKKTADLFTSPPEEVMKKLKALRHK